MIRSCRIYKPCCKTLCIRASGLIRNILACHQYRSARHWVYAIPYTECHVIVQYLFHLNFYVGGIHNFRVSSYRIVVFVFCRIFVYSRKYLERRYAVLSGILNFSCKRYLHVLHPVFCFLVTDKECHDTFIGSTFQLYVFYRILVH